ncbi:DUF6153 family protein [Kineosporia sp. NBRC 101731]|uniref:DUF6153 family protein n=1 Tax=Kineosporia sp. NBRC 101731 TaxID=3032199 RepID=UPI0024A047F1|nr:DUF6153 family protein [Kineosporia sp. NBRC 101731]GLY31328.1 hypothetical protein Kisp02_46930 [Kineosporia sp. NBRC 101731]
MRRTEGRRLVVLAAVIAVLAGLLAMHALSMGGHGDHPQTGVTTHQEHGRTPAPDHDQHEMTTMCQAVLSGAAAFVLLLLGLGLLRRRVFRESPTNTCATTSSFIGQHRRPPPSLTELCISRT